MKFTKLTSSVLAGATLLSILAPTATFAATDGTAAGNGGTELPQTDKTEVGISFGDNTHNANTGYLRLQMVPHVLDFGNHQLLDAAYPTFSADGTNDGKTANDRHPNYDNGDANMTATLNTSDTKLDKVNGDVWATVVDKQVTRDNVDANNTAASGTWTLSVKADNGLAAVSTSGARSTTDVVDGASLSFANTASAQTSDVFGLTSEAQDATWATDLANAATTEVVKPVSTVNDATLSLMNDGSGNEATVAVAQDGEGQGADVFGWKKSDVKLTMPKAAAVSNAVYKANLTWTLSATVA